MYLNALRAFEAAARHESLSKAAIELNVSHSVVSQHVRNLEEWMDKPLFIRFGNRVELTEDARFFATRISEAFSLLSEACGNYKGTSGELSLNITAEPAFARRWLRRRLANFQSLHPKIRVNLRSDATPPNLKDGTTDVAIHFESLLLNEGSSQDRILPIDAFPACSPAFLEKNPHVRNDSQAILSLPLVHDNGRTVWRQWFNKYYPDSNAWEKGPVHSDLLLALDSALDGEGIFLADDLIFKREMKSGSLIQLDVRRLLCTWYCAVYNDTKPSNPAILAFRKWLPSQLS